VLARPVPGAINAVVVDPVVRLNDVDAVILDAANVPVKVGFADKTTDPVPVEVVVPVPPFATARVPVA
jgi:hypothetical protein